MPYIGRDLNRGNYLKLDDISSSFDSSTTTFNLTVGGSAFRPGSAFSILVSVGGVIQEPESAYQVNNSEITFANAPTAQDSFFCIALGVSLGIGVPGNGTVNGTQMAKPFNYDGFFYLDDANNRVGINSSAPKVALDVNGNAKISGILTAGSYSGPISNPSGISTFYDVRVINNLTVEGTTTTLDTDLTAVDRVEVDANSNSIVGVAITQSGTADIINLFDGNTEVLTVQDGGNVGIGTNTAGARLQVDGSGSNTTLNFLTRDVNDNNIFWAQDGGRVGLHYYPFVINQDTTDTATPSGTYFYVHHTSNPFIIKSDGKVGIGTDNPLNPLEVVGSSVDLMLYDTQAYSQNVSGSAIVFAGKDSAGIRKSFADVRGVANGSNIGEFAIRTRRTGGNLTEALRIDSDGKVGIGTDNPTRLMSIDGDMNLASGSKIESYSSGGNLQIQGGSTYPGGHIKLYGGSGDDMITFNTSGASTSSTERFRIDQYGNAGLGTAPRTAAGGVNNDTDVFLAIGDNDTGIAQDGDGQFEIWANNQEIANFNAANVTLTKDLYIPDKLRHDGDSDTQIRFPAADTISFETDGSERLRILSSGEIGIGITNPTKTGIQNLVKVLQIDGGDGAELILGNSQSSNVAANHIGAIAFKNIDNSVSAAPNYAGIRCNATDTVGNMNLKFYAGSTAFESDTPHMTIISNGNVGIGTATPGDILHLRNTAPILKVDATNNSSGLRIDVLGQTGGSNNQLFRVQRDGTTKLQLNDDGDLVITGDDNAELKLKAGTTTGNGVIAFLNSSGTTKGNIFYDTDDNFMVFKTDGTASSDERLRITSSGRVNIGGNYTQDNDQLHIIADTGKNAIGFGATTQGMKLGWDGDNSSYDSVRIYHVDYSNSSTYGIAGNNPTTVIQSDSIPGSGTVNSTVWLKRNNSGNNAGRNIMNLCVDGDITIGGAGEENGVSITGVQGSKQSGFGVSKLSIQPDDRTTAFSASDGNTWHDVVIKQRGGATNNAAGIAFQVADDSYHINAGTGICAVKNGTNSDYGSDLVFITRPQSAVSEERLRIESDGNIKQNLSSPSGTSPFQDSHWYDRDGANYTLSTTDHNSLTAVRTSSGGVYNKIVYKRVKMSKNCDIEFDLSGNTPSGTYRHVGFTLNADGSTANYDRLVFRSRPSSTSSNQIRIDKANGAGYGFQNVGTHIPTFFDGTERHIIIQLRERLVNVIVDGEVIISEKNNADFYNSSGWFGFAIYEGGESAQVTIRNLEIRNKFQIPRWLVRASQNNVDLDSADVLPYNTVILASSDMNNASHYNTGSYRFNVPISGLYYVFFRAYRNSSTSTEVAFYVNASVRNRFRPQPNGGDYIFTGSCLIQLMKGDYIDVRAHNGTFDNFYGNNDQNFSSWGGHLLD